MGDALDLLWLACASGTIRGGRDCLTASNQADHSFPSGDRDAGAPVRVAPGPFRATKLRHPCLVLGVTFGIALPSPRTWRRGYASRAIVSPRRRKVRIVIVGATGFIGSAAAARLSAQGHQVIAVARRKQPLGLIPATIVNLDVAQATDPADWIPHLAGVDAVLNCAGTLQDGPGNSTKGVHVEGPLALFKACEMTGIRRIVHLSAVGVDRATPTAFSRTKLAGDQALMALDLDWVILRPSVVVGRGAYGGSALLRGLAALPIMPLIPAGRGLAASAFGRLGRGNRIFLAAQCPEPHSHRCGRTAAFCIRRRRTLVSQMASMAGGAGRPDSVMGG
jgi:uncharacterized protein YbjT (DUF2867 family)